MQEEIKNRWRVLATVRDRLFCLFVFYLKTLSMLFSTGVKLGLLQEGKYAKVTENTVLRKMFEPKKQEVLEVWG